MDTMNPRSAVDVAAEVEALVERLPQAIAHAVAEASAAVASERVYAMCVRVGQGWGSLGIVGNTVEAVDRWVAEFGSEWRADATISMDEWTVGTYWLDGVNSRLDEIRATDRDLFTDSFIPLWKRAVVDAVLKLPLRSMVQTSFEGDVLIGLAAHELESVFPEIVEVSEKLNTSAWHDEVLAYQTWFETEEWPDGHGQLV